MNWVVGERVYLEDAPERVGTVTEAGRNDIKVVWDDGGESIYQSSDDYLRLKYATSPNP